MTIFDYLDARITQLTIEYKENSLLVQTAEQNAARLITKAQFFFLTIAMIPKHFVCYVLVRFGVLKQATKQELGELNKAKIASMIAARGDAAKKEIEAAKAKLSSEEV